MKIKTLYTILLGVLIVLGCREPGPIELQEPDQKQELEILTTENFTMSTLDSIDVSSPHPPIPRGVSGRLLVAEVVVDGPHGRREASIAHAIFFDKSSPLVLERDTAAYALRDVGNMFIDLLQLNKREKQFFHPRMNRDTLLGVEYFLVNVNGMGGRGFRYVGNKVYEWRSSGNQPIAPFSMSVTSAASVRITQPSSSVNVSITEPLSIQWRGGGDFMRLVISSVEGHQQPKPIFQARVRTQRHGVIVPAKILQALPRSQLNFLLTLSSETREELRTNGFPEPLLLHTSSSHSIMIRVLR